MSALIFLLISFAALVILALRQAPLAIWAASLAALTLIAQYGLPFLEPIVAFSSGAWVGWVIAGVMGALSINSLRHRLVISTLNFLQTDKQQPTTQVLCKWPTDHFLLYF